MITQYSRVQLTLSEKEKEYAWFSYAAKIIRAGCNDQQMSGYTVTGTGIDGQEIKAELTNEELFQLFSEITMKYGRKLVTQEMEQHSLDQESDELLKPDITDRPLERRDYQIQITRHELKTRKADVTITWGNNLKVEGLYVASRVRGGVRLSVPDYAIACFHYFRLPVLDTYRIIFHHCHGVSVSDGPSNPALPAYLHIQSQFLLLLISSVLEMQHDQQDRKPGIDLFPHVKQKREEPEEEEDWER